MASFCPNLARTGHQNLGGWDVWEVWKVGTAGHRRKGVGKGILSESKLKATGQGVNYRWQNLTRPARVVKIVSPSKKKCLSPNPWYL